MGQRRGDLVGNVGGGVMGEGSIAGRKGRGERGIRGRRVVRKWRTGQWRGEVSGEEWSGEMWISGNRGREFRGEWGPGDGIRDVRREGGPGERRASGY